MGQPDHAVEVAQDARPGRGGSTGAPYRRRARPWPTVGAAGATARMGRCPASSRSAPSATRPSVDLDAVVAPPYDVLSDADVDALAARDPHNIVHVDVPRGGPDRYERGRRGCCGRGSPTACCVRRRRRRRSRSTACASPTPPARARDLVGVLGGLEVVDEGAGGVLPHERTTPKASTDRLDLTRATERQPLAGLGPVAGGRPDRRCSPSPASPSARSPSTASSTSSSGSPTATGSPPSASTSARDDVLIADGHHRYGISRTYRDEVRAGDGPRPTPPPSRRSPSSASSSPSSSASRRSTGSTGGMPFDDLRAALARCVRARRRPTRRRRRRWPRWSSAGRLVLVGPRRRRVADARAPARSTASAPLDGAWLEHALDGHRRPRSPTSTASTRCSPPSTRGAATAAVLIRPVEHRRDRAHRPRGPADAAEVDVLHAQAAHRLRVREL